MHMLRHLVRSDLHARVLVPKSILVSDAPIKATIGHYPIRCFGDKNGQCNLHYIDHKVAHLAHYREGCQQAVNKWCHLYLNSTVEDTAILRFKDELFSRVKQTLQDLKFFQD